MNVRPFLRDAAHTPIDAIGESAMGKAIARLPDALRWVMLLGGRNGLSICEIAALAGVSQKIVESTQHRGLALLQKELLNRASGLVNKSGRTA